MDCVWMPVRWWWWCRCLSSILQQRLGQWPLEQGAGTGAGTWVGGAYWGLGWIATSLRNANNFTRVH